MTHDSPQIVATVDTRMSIPRPSISMAIWPSCGSASFDDVHSSHDLEPAHEGRAHRRGQFDRIVKRAVDPESHSKPLVLRLDVNVGCSVTKCLSDEQVDDLDDGGVIGQDLLGGGVRRGPTDGRLGSGELLHVLFDHAQGAVRRVDGALDVRARSDEELHLPTGGAGQGLAELRAWIRNCNGDAVVVDLERYGQMGSRDGFWHQGDGVGRGRPLGEIGEWNSKLLRQRVGELLVGDCARIDEQGPDALARVRLLEKRLGQLGGSDLAGTEKHVAQEGVAGRGCGDLFVGLHSSSRGR